MRTIDGPPRVRMRKAPALSNPAPRDAIETIATFIHAKGLPSPAECDGQKRWQ
jgi:hypothetical protein